MAIDINTPPGAPPRELLHEVLCDIFDRVTDTADRGDCPPQLLPSIDEARAAQRADDVDELDRRLQQVAQAAIASLVRIRAAAESRPPGS